MKLNKGEKRVLKFMLQRETGQTIDINAFLKSQDIGELRTLLAKESKLIAKENIKEQLTGTKRREGYKGYNNSNKIYDFNEFATGN